MIAFLTHILVEIINLTFVGHLGKAILMAGVGIGNMYINIFSHSVAVDPSIILLEVKDLN